MFYSNDYILHKLYLDFSSNWMSGHKTRIFLSTNYEHNSQIKMDNNLWNAYRWAALNTDLKTETTIPNF